MWYWNSDYCSYTQLTNKITDDGVNGDDSDSDNERINNNKRKWRERKKERNSLLKNL